MSNDEERWTPPSGGSTSGPETPTDGSPSVGSGWGAPIPPPPSSDPDRSVPGSSSPWMPPTDPHRTQSQAPSWMSDAQPASGGSSQNQSSGSKRIWGWLAVVVVSALTGATIGAAVVASDDDGSTETSTPSTIGTVTQQQISAPATPSTIRSVLERVQPAVVSVQASGSGTSGSGTGMIVSTDGYILTNAHVVNGASSIRVTLDDRKESIAARLLGMDPSIDSAIIKIEPPSNLVAVELGDSGQLLVGDQVVAIGNALALAGGPSVTTGIVSAKDREISDGTQTLTNLVQTDAAINPGNSGGPLVNMAGQVIGMNTAVIRGQGGEFQNIGFAMAVNAIKPAIEDLKAGKVHQQALLGVSAVTLDDDIRDRYGLTPTSGAVIDSVTPNGPADAAGLRRFDVVVQVDGDAIETSEDLTSRVRAHRPDDRVKIVFFRGDDRREVDVTLAARPTSG